MCRTRYKGNTYLPVGDNYYTLHHRLATESISFPLHTYNLAMFPVYLLFFHLNISKFSRCFSRHFKLKHFIIKSRRRIPQK